MPTQNALALRAACADESRARATTRWRGIWAGVVVVAFADQLTKAAAPALADLTDIVEPAENRELLLGLAALPAWATAALALAVGAAFLVPLRRGYAAGSLAGWVVVLTLGGALGNLIDRIALGGVRDFLVLPFALANLADLCVIAGLVGYALTRRASNEPETAPRSPSVSSPAAAVAVANRRRGGRRRRLMNRGPMSGGISDRGSRPTRPGRRHRWC